MSDHDDAAMFASLRSLWRDVDPMPADLIDRMVAAVAADGLNREYALLTLVEGQVGAVRGDADALTLQFSDGTTSILLHVTSTASGCGSSARRAVTAVCSARAAPRSSGPTLRCRSVSWAMRSSRRTQE